MRHAESEFNKMQQEWAEKHSLPKSHLCRELRFLNDPHVVDALLTSSGIDQCREASREIAEKYPNIKYVLLSPMRRTVATAVESLRDVHNGLEWKIVPWLREILNSNCDIGYHTIEYLEQHPHIDASELENDKLWFLNFYHECPETRHSTKLRELHGEDPRVETILEYMDQSFGTMEKPFQLLFRAEKAREVIRQFIQDKESQGIAVNDDEILVVSHSKILKAFYGTFDAEGNVQPGYEHFEFKNAEIKPYDIVME